MRTTLRVAAAAMLVCSPALGAEPSITYKLQLGGNNGADGWTTGTPPVFDTAGVVEPPDVYTMSQTTVTWSVRVAVSGDGPDGTPVSGAANLVWDLRLYGPDGNLVGPDFGLGSPTTPGFFSTIQDNSVRDGILYETETAAFPWVFDVDNAGVYGRIWDPVSSGGPHMAQFTYPNTFGFTEGSLASSGTLMGMGAGYASFDINDFQERGGVGLSTGSTGCVQDIAARPIAEGQINLRGLQPGTYTLELVPGHGNNALWIDESLGSCQTGSDGAFAIPVTPGNVHGSTIQFIYPALERPVLVAASSVRQHGTVGAFGLPIALSGNASVECRQGGPQQVALTYSEAMVGTPVVTLTATGGPAPTLGTVVLLDNTLTINMSGAVSWTCIKIAVAGITGADGMAPPDQDYVKLTCRYCDVDGNHRTNASDVVLIKAHSRLANVDATNFWYDVDCNGKINASDVSAIKAQSALGSTTCTYP